MGKKKPPQSADDLRKQIGPFLESLQEETDRGAALVAAAYLDSSLRELVRKAWVDDSKVASRLLDDGAPPPVGSFSLRTSLAYMMGLISPQLYRMISKIRVIRNIFGHEHGPKSFEEPEISEECRKLMEQDSFWAVSKRILPEKPRFVFLASASVAANQLALLELGAKHALPKKDPEVHQAFSV